MKKTLILILLTLSLALSLGAKDRTQVVRTHSKVGESDHLETVVTVDGIDGYSPVANPKTDIYGGWKIANLRATGFFRVEKYRGRWWIVTPDGHPFICRAVSSFTHGPLGGQYFKENFGTSEVWAEEEIPFLKDNGFNCAGAWSNTRVLMNSQTKIPYCVYVSVLKKHMKANHPDINSQKYVLVFDNGLIDAVKAGVKTLAVYKDDPWCLGIFVDNELPFGNDLLEFYLNDLPSDDPNHIEALNYLKKRKNGPEAPVTVLDRELFAVQAFEHYQKMVKNALMEVDRNHMYLGCRLHSWGKVLCNEHLVKASAAYFDIVSFNHYGRWTPSPKLFDKWSEMCGRPLMVTEFYTKGEDAGMENTPGAGWIVPTQRDRGLFYQNFTRCLLQSSGCVGWHWFQYRDKNSSVKLSQAIKDSNKGIVDYKFNRYDDLLDQMKTLNSNCYGVLRHYQSHPVKKGAAILIDGCGKDSLLDARFKAMADSLDFSCSLIVDPAGWVLDGRFWSSDKNRIHDWRREGHSIIMKLGDSDEAVKKGYDNLTSVLGYYASPMNAMAVNTSSSPVTYSEARMAALGERFKYIIGGTAPKDSPECPKVIEPLRLSLEAGGARGCKALVSEAFGKQDFVILEMTVSDALALPELIAYVKDVAAVQPLTVALPSWIK